MISDEQRFPSAEETIAKAGEAAFGRPLVMNTLRALLVEAMVAQALGAQWRWCGSDWAGFDFEHAGGCRLEVKQSAARQSWPKTSSRPARPTFDIAERQGRWEGERWVADVGRPAAIYIFAWHPVTDETTDHREPAQWIFHVVPTAALPPTRSIGLAAVSSLARPVSWAGLHGEVELARMGVLVG